MLLLLFNIESDVEKMQYINSKDMKSPNSKDMTPPNLSPRNIEPIRSHLKSKSSNLDFQNSPNTANKLEKDSTHRASFFKQTISRGIFNGSIININNDVNKKVFELFFDCYGVYSKAFKK